MAAPPVGSRPGLRGQEASGSAVTGVPLPPPPASRSRRGPRRPSDPVAGFRPTPLGPLGRRQIRVSDEGTGSISGPDPRPSSLQLPRGESPTRPASGVWRSPPRLRPRQDEVRALTAGAPPHSASEPLGPTPTGGGDLCNPSGLCFDLVRRSTGPRPASADPAHLPALGPDRLGHISGTDFFRFFRSRSL
ncbi:hypothetical protein NDU88_000448 [Pleurodeles waltl]|uniref:Basic proline-rich protein-like n=1 Tax=Pleurodeles waltl TaxID=8319 RepID=A0AAV7NBD6_PLEWA|nr:hypothetical protein NDU88_000448 [Pleurodeles waltl]